MRTVLGSCVGVAFFAQESGVAALCHPMLPHGPAGRQAGTGRTESRRFVDFAIREIAEELRLRGIERRSVRVKLFGGADVLGNPQPGDRPTVGKLNCEAARRVLREEGFAIAAESLGGTCGVHLQFDTSTGEVLLRRLPR